MSTTTKTALSATEQEERSALLNMFVPDFLVNFHQDSRNALGMKPIGSPWIYMIGAVYLLFCMIVITILYMVASSIFGFGLNNPLIKTIFFFFFMFVILYLVYYFGFRPPSKDNIFVAATGDVRRFFEGFENAPPSSLDPSNQPLLNLQPMAMKQAGYIGPRIQDGTFDLDTGLRSALKNGVRAFTLQIDYLEKKKDPEKFAPVGEPTLLYRNDSGLLISSNGASLKEAAAMIANYAFAEESIGSTLPLILYLHFTRTPNPIKEPEEYLKFLSATAEALEPIQPHVLTNSPEGPTSRQRNEIGVLRTPVSQLSKKIILISNADTTLFRRTEQLAMKDFDQKKDLDAMVHIRAYAETSDDILGASGLAPVNSTNVHAILVKLDRVLKLSEKEKGAFRDMSRTRFVIALTPQMSNPSLEDLRAAYSLGINLVPILPFGNTAEEQARIIALWKPEKFLKERPVALQVGATPSAANKEA